MGREATVLAFLPCHQPAKSSKADARVATEASSGTAVETEPYTSDVFAKMFEEQASFMVPADYMESQKEINGKMRAILIDWLIEVHMKYKMRVETLFLACSIIDRYLSAVQVVRRRLQLVGVVAMLIAAKFEEINPPQVDDFVYITDRAYTKEDVLAEECAMLAALGFRVASATAAHFLKRLTVVNRCNDEHSALVQYVTELALVELQFVRFAPSRLAAAAVLLSNEVMRRQTAWPEQLAICAGHSEQELAV